MSDGMPERDLPFQLILSHSWTSHMGDEARQSPAQIEAAHKEALEAVALQDLLASFQAAAAPLADKCVRDASSHQPSDRFRRHHFDGGIDILHVTEVIAACASAVPLALVIKAARDVLTTWLKRKSRGIKIKLGAGREIEVRSVAELDAVLSRLETSDFAKPPAKAPARAAAKQEAPEGPAEAPRKRAAGKGSAQTGVAPAGGAAKAKAKSP